MISDAKKEILKTIPTETCCSYSFLNSLFSSVKTDFDGKTLITETPKFLEEKTREVISKLYENIEIKYDDEKMKISGYDLSQMLLDAGLISSTSDTELCLNGINEDIIKTECCELTFLKTLFLTSGNLYFNKNDNEKSSGYLLEFIFKNYALHDDTKALLKYLGIKVSSTKRANNMVIYTKDSQTIYNFFVMTKAVETAIEIQNALIIRELRNESNRESNCFDANLNKTISASLDQVKAIDYINRTVGLNTLPENLQEVALLRLANPDITLSEMQNLYSTKVSRAGLKYKLDKIIEIYKKLDKED